VSTTIERAMAAKAAKSTVHIKNVTELGSRLFGTVVSGHPSIPDGHNVLTSEIVSEGDYMGERTDLVETQNTRYIVDNWL